MNFVQTTQSCIDPCFWNYHMELGFGERFYEDKEDYDISEKDTTADTFVYSVA